MINSKTMANGFYILDIRDKNSDCSIYGEKLYDWDSLEEIMNQIDCFMETKLINKNFEDEYVYIIKKINEKGEIINVIKNTFNFKDIIKEKWFSIVLFVNQVNADDFEKERYEHHKYKGYYKFDDKLIYGIENIEEYFENISKKYENNNIFLELKPLEKDSNAGNEYRPYTANQYANQYQYQYHSRLLTYYMTKDIYGDLVLSDIVDIY